MTTTPIAHSTAADQNPPTPCITETPAADRQTCIARDSVGRVIVQDGLSRMMSTGDISNGDTHKAASLLRAFATMCDAMPKMPRHAGDLPDRSSTLPPVMQKLLGRAALKFDANKTFLMPPPPKHDGLPWLNPHACAVVKDGCPGLRAAARAVLKSPGNLCTATLDAKPHAGMRLTHT